MKGLQLLDINLDAITDPAARQFVGHLLNVIETLHPELVQLRAANQQGQARPWVARSPHHLTGGRPGDPPRWAGQYRVTGDRPDQYGRERAE